MTDIKVMDKLLALYDWHIRLATLDAEEYIFGYADAIGQAILEVGKLLGETGVPPYKYEAYKRVMQYDTTANYWKKYPKPIASFFPAEVIRRNGGTL